MKRPRASSQPDHTQRRWVRIVVCAYIVLLPIAWWVASHDLSRETSFTRRCIIYADADASRYVYEPDGASTQVVGSYFVTVREVVYGRLPARREINIALQPNVSWEVKGEKVPAEAVRPEDMLRAAAVSMASNDPDFAQLETRISNGQARVIVHRNFTAELINAHVCLLLPALFIALVWTTAKATRAQTRSQRRMTNQCVSCGYPMTDLMRCPECGNERATDDEP